MLGRRRSGPQRRRQDVRRRHGILDGEVDADAADRRHRVRGVADAQESRAVPPGEAVHANRQELHVVPGAQFPDLLAQHRREPGHAVAKGREAGGADSLERALRDHVAALPVVAAVDHDEDLPRVEAPHALRRALPARREVEPQHVHRSSQLLHLQSGLRAERGVSPVGRDDEIAADRDRARQSGCLHADHAPRLLEQPGRFGPHHQAENRKPAGLSGQEIEEVPLRHEDQEPAARRQVTEVGERHGDLADLDGQLADLLMRKLQEVVEQPQLMHDVERRGVDRVAPEVPEEIGVLLEHEDGDAGARQQQAEHHAGRSAAGDAALHGACALVHESRSSLCRRRRLSARVAADRK